MQRNITHVRSSTFAAFRVRCSERLAPGHDSKAPVKLVVFDLDETLTLVTFMSKDGKYSPKEYAFTTMVNFESPWVDGSRVAKLQSRKYFKQA